MHLLCTFGIHRPEWRAMTTNEPRWLQVRECRVCGHLVGKPKLFR